MSGRPSKRDRKMLAKAELIGELINSLGLVDCEFEADTSPLPYLDSSDFLAARRELADQLERWWQRIQPAPTQGDERGGR